MRNANLNAVRKYHAERKAERSKRNAGIALMALNVAGFAALFAGAYQIDKAHGITPAESMCNNGFSTFCDAKPARHVVAVATDSDDAAAEELTGRIVAEMAKRDCKFRRDGAAEYTLESCK